MYFIKLILSTVLLLATGTAGASSLQCRNLFVLDTKVITKSDTEKRIETLAVSYLQLGEIKPELKQQVIADINKELSILMQVNKDTISLFKEKVSKLKNTIESSRQRKEKEDETRRKDRQKSIVENQSPINLARKIILHEIRPGKFMMGESFMPVETIITKPFAMMQTQFTQMMWARLQIAMGEKDLRKINPSEFKTGDDSVKVNIEGITVEMKPDHPVEQVSYNDVADFIVGLNKLSNSKEIKDQNLLTHLIPDHQKGDVYDLPTEAQWEFVMRNRGNANEAFFDSAYQSDLAMHAWFYDNSDNQTHEVATKRARLIDGKEFFDLEGNVFEWNKDWYHAELKGGFDPEGTTPSSYRVFRGGSVYDAAGRLRSDDRDFGLVDSSSDNLGFRLVRTRP